jgi:hypothetical protein
MFSLRKYKVEGNMEFCPSSNEGEVEEPTIVAEYRYCTDYSNVDLRLQDKLNKIIFEREWLRKGEQIKEFLANNPQIRSLDFRPPSEEQIIGVTGIEAIAYALTNNTQITSLDLSGKYQI